MERKAILRKLDRLERRIEALESENEALRNENAQLKNENAQLKKENAELKETIERYADAKAAKKPKFPLNYSSERNEPPDDSGNKKRTKKNKNDKKRKKPGRKPKDTKPDQADFIEKIFPEGVARRRCVLRREQFVWRLVGHEAKYVHYQQSQNNYGIFPWSKEGTGNRGQVLNRVLPANRTCFLLSIICYANTKVALVLMLLLTGRMIRSFRNINCTGRIS